MAKIVTYDEIAVIASRFKKIGWNVMLKTGCFNIVHIGHIKMLKKIADKTDLLIVGVGSNNTLRKLKKEYVFDEKYRAEVIASLNMVHYVVILDEEWDGVSDHNKLLQIVQPTLYHLSDEDTVHVRERKKIVESMGIKVIMTKPVSIIQNNQELEPHSSDLKNKL